MFKENSWAGKAVTNQGESCLKEVHIVSNKFDTQAPASSYHSRGEIFASSGDL